MRYLPQKETALFVASQAFAVWYWSNCVQCKEKTNLDIAAKLLSSSALAYYAYLKSPTKKERNASLLMHSIGDGLIELKFKHNMLCAIAFFFFGHFLYFQHLGKTSDKLSSLGKMQTYLFAFFSLASIAITFSIWRETRGAISNAILAYAPVLASIVLSSALQKQNAPLKTLCALTYVLSDVLIATRSFMKSNPLGALASSMVTFGLYFGGQSTLVFSDERQKNAQVALKTDRQPQRLALR